MQIRIRHKNKAAVSLIVLDCQFDSFAVLTIGQFLQILQIIFHFNKFYLSIRLLITLFPIVLKLFPPEVAEPFCLDRPLFNFSLLPPHTGQSDLVNNAELF